MNLPVTKKTLIQKTYNNGARVAASELQTELHLHLSKLLIVSLTILFQRVLRTLRTVLQRLLDPFFKFAGHTLTKPQKDPQPIALWLRFLREIWFMRLRLFKQLNPSTSNFCRPLLLCKGPSSSIPYSCGDVSVSCLQLRYILSHQLPQSLLPLFQSAFPNLNINHQFRVMLESRIPTVQPTLLLHTQPSPFKPRQTPNLNCLFSFQIIIPVLTLSYTTHKHHSFSHLFLVPTSYSSHNYWNDQILFLWY